MKSKKLAKIIQESMKEGAKIVTDQWMALIYAQNSMAVKQAELNIQMVEKQTIFQRVIAEREFNQTSHEEKMNDL